MPPSRTSRALVSVLAAATLLGAACGGSFRRSEALSFVQPLQDTPLEQPVTIAWEVDPDTKSRVEAEGLIFGVFVDRTPLSVGGSLLDLADDDCRAQEGCPNAEWLADRDVYATRGQSLHVGSLGDNRTSDRDGAEDRHEAVVVLLDSSGTRVDESWWSVSFLVDRS